MKNVKHEIYTSLSKNHKPCIKENTQNLFKEIYTAITRIIGCILPWSKYELGTSTNIPGIYALM